MTIRYSHDRLLHFFCPRVAVATATRSLRCLAAGARRSRTRDRTSQAGAAVAGAEGGRAPGPCRQAMPPLLCHRHVDMHHGQRMGSAEDLPARHAVAGDLSPPVVLHPPALTLRVWQSPHQEAARAHPSHNDRRQVVCASAPIAVVTSPCLARSPSRPEWWHS
jgi:hypothetical protein